MATRTVSSRYGVAFALAACLASGVCGAKNVSAQASQSVPAQAQPTAAAQAALLEQYFSHGSQLMSLPSTGPGADYFQHGGQATSLPAPGQPGADYFQHGGQATSLPAPGQPGADYFQHGGQATSLPAPGQPGADYFQHGGQATSLPAPGQPGADYFQHGGQTTSLAAQGQSGAEYFQNSEQVAQPTSEPNENANAAPPVDESSSTPPANAANEQAQDPNQVQAEEQQPTSPPETEVSSEPPPLSSAQPEVSSEPPPVSSAQPEASAPNEDTDQRSHQQPSAELAVTASELLSAPHASLDASVRLPEAVPTQRPVPQDVFAHPARTASKVLEVSAFVMLGCVSLLALVVMLGVGLLWSTHRARHRGRAV
jgi:hypothetical protein